MTERDLPYRERARRRVGTPLHAPPGDNELTTTQETDTTQVEERDQQSTSRNELSTEAEKRRRGRPPLSKTTSTDYGKLGENSRTNYARSVTDRAVNTLTQTVKLQRVQREKKTFTEKAVHELDNRQNPRKGARNLSVGR